MVIPLETNTMPEFHWSQMRPAFIITFMLSTPCWAQDNQRDVNTTDAPAIVILDSINSVQNPEVLCNKEKCNGESPPPPRAVATRTISDSEALQLERQHRIERRRKWLENVAAKGAIYTISELWSEPIRQHGVELPGYKIFLRKKVGKKGWQSFAIQVYIDSSLLPHRGDKVALHNPVQTGDTVRLSEMIVVEGAVQ